MFNRSFSQNRMFNQQKIKRDPIGKISLRLNKATKFNIKNLQKTKTALTLPMLFSILNCFKILLNSSDKAM